MEKLWYSLICFIRIVVRKKTPKVIVLHSFIALWWATSEAFSPYLPIAGESGVVKKEVNPKEEDCGIKHPQEGPVDKDPPA